MGEVDQLWWFMLWGYPLTVALEFPVLWLGLAPRHPRWRRVGAAFWLTACSYPIVVLVLPTLLADWSRPAYLAVAETFAPLSECILFWLAFPPDRAAGAQDGRATWIRDGVAIVAANLFSFSMGELLYRLGWL